MTTRQQQLEETFSLAMNRRPEPAPAPESDAQGPIAGRKKDMHSFILSAHRIRPDDDQVRRMGKEVSDPGIQELAESIRQYGIQHALDVRWLPEEDIYELVSGERRFVAATQIVGLTELPVRIIERPEDEILLLQLTENVQRADLHPLDLAASIRRLMERGMTMVEVAKKIAKSKSWVQKALTVSEALSPEAQAAAEEAKVSSLDVLYDVAQVPANEQEELVQRIASEKLTQKEVRAATAEAKKRNRGTGKGRTGRPVKSKPFSKRFSLSNGATLTVQFRKAKVSQEELVAVAREWLGSLEAAQAA